MPVCSRCPTENGNCSGQIPENAVGRPFLGRLVPLRKLRLIPPKNSISPGLKRNNKTGPIITMAFFCVCLSVCRLFFSSLEPMIDEMTTLRTCVAWCGDVDLLFVMSPELVSLRFPSVHCVRSSSAHEWQFVFSSQMRENSPHSRLPCGLHPAFSAADLMQHQCGNRTAIHPFRSSFVVTGSIAASVPTSLHIAVLNSVCCMFSGPMGFVPVLTRRRT